MAIDFKKFIKGIVLGNDVDPSKKLQVEVTSSATTATKTTVQASQTANRTIILPDASDTLVGKATTDTLTNKTFDADGTGNSITNIENADIKSGAAIDAAKLADGSVSNTEYQYLANVTSDIQTQFNNTNTAITDHIADATDAHDASAISNIPTGNLAATDVQNALNELQTDVDTRLLKAGDTMSGNLNMGSNLITSLATPVSGTDAANKNYVDGISAGLDPKESVRVATAASVGGSYATTPSNGQFTGAATSVDGVALSVSDRVLIKDQVDQKQNGIYVYTASGEFTRSSDMDGSPASEVSGGNFVFVAEGATNSASGYVLIANGIVTLNTDNLVFTQFSGGANSANKVLSNLDSPTAINQDLLPGTDNTIDLGSSTKRYVDGYIQVLKDSAGVSSVSIEGRILRDSSGAVAVDFGNINQIDVNNKRIANLTNPAALTDALNKRSAQALIKNFISDGDAEGAQIFSVYNDSSTTRPVDGTGGTQANLSVSISGTSPLDGNNSFLLTKSGSASTQGSGFAAPFTIGNAYKAKVLQIEMDYIVNSGTFVAGSSATESDMIVYLYDVTNSVLIEPSSIKLLSNSSTIADKFVANFQTSATGTSYRLILHCQSTSTANYTIKCEVAVKPCNYVYGTPITDWVSYTPAGTWSTTFTGLWRRVGQDMEVKFQAATSGGVSGNFTVNIPTGYTIDTTKLLSTSTQEELGFGRINDSGSAVYHFSLRYNSNVSIVGINLGAAGTYLNEPSVVDGTTPITFGAGDFVNGYFKVPISGWSSSVQVSDGYDGRAVVLKVGLTTGQAVSTNAVLKYDTKEVDTTNSYDIGTGLFTVPSSGNYKISVVAFEGGTSANIYLKVNSTNKGVLFTTSSDTRSGSTILPLNAGDTVGVYNNNGGTFSAIDGTLGFLNTLSIEKIAAPTTISATEVVAARYSTAAGQTISTSSVTIIDFATKDYDTHNAVTTGASWKFTAPVSGFYSVKAHTMYSDAAWAVDDKLSMEIYKNGTQNQNLRYYEITAATTAFSDLVGSGDIYLNAGDFIDIRNFQNSGSSKTIITQAIYNHVAISRIK